MQDGAITLAAVRRLDQSSGVKMVEVRAGKRPHRAEAAEPGLEGGAGQGRQSGQDLVSGWLQGPPDRSPVSALFFPHSEAKAVLLKHGSGRVIPLLSSLNISCPLRIKIQVLTVTRRYLPASQPCSRCLCLLRAPPATWPPRCPSHVPHCFRLSSLAALCPLPGPLLSQIPPSSRSAQMSSREALPDTSHHSLLYPFLDCI